MNINKEIKNYVKMNLKNGYSKEHINNALLSSGYSQEFALDIIEECSERKQLNSVWVYLILILIVSLSVFFVKPAFIGYTTVSKEINYSEELNLVIDSTAEYIWAPANKGDIKSIRISGTFETKGDAVVYIENNNISYKLFNSSSVEGLSSITGADAAQENSFDNNDSAILAYNNICEETCLLNGFMNDSYKIVFELSNTSINISRITYSIVEETEMFNISVLLINSKGPAGNEIKVYKENNLIDENEVEAGLYEIEIEPSEKVIEKINFRGVNVSADFSGKVGIDNITGVSAEGIDAVKSFAVDPSGIEFENASLKAIAKAPVLYKCKEWNFTEQKCYGNWTKIMELDVGEEYELEIDKNDPGFIEGFPEEENNAPVCSIIPNMVVGENSSFSFDLDDYCSDIDGDTLYYIYNAAENITINIDESAATINPDKGFRGIRYTFFIANDSEDVYVSNIIKINVSEGYAEETERTVKGLTVNSISDNSALNTMNIQGRLTSANNTNLNGDYNFTFKIYNISAGGSALWEENHSLNVNDGVYDAIVGSTVPIELEFDEPYYLGISVNNDNEMSPRLNLTSAPYSRRAVMAENLTCIGCVAADEILNGTITTADMSASAGILETQLEKTFVDTAGDIMTGDLIGAGVNISYLNVSGTALINILNVTGSTNIGNINISGVSFAEGDISVNNNVNITSDGNVQLSQDLAVGQDGYFGGNLGIGVILPQERLEIDGAVKLGTTVSTNNGTLRYVNNIFQGYNGSDWLTLSGGSISGTTGWVDDGPSLKLTTLTDSVGIGTNSPTAKLDVIGTINATAIKTITLNVTGISYLGSTAIQSDNITVNNIISRDGNISIYNSSGSEKIRLTNEGNLGIGTLTPNEKLTVIGNVNITGTVYARNFSGNSDIMFINNTGETKMIIKDSGNVGIGVISPTAKLDVSGTINGSAVTVNGINVGLHSGISGENITTGIVADARIAAAIARDNEIVSLIDNGSLIRDYNVSWLVVNLDNSTIVRDYAKTGNSTAEIWGVIDNETFARLTGFSGENITSGTVADAFIDSIITRDSELENSTIIRDYNTSWVQAIKATNATHADHSSVAYDLAAVSPVISDLEVDNDITVHSTKTINTTAGINVSGGAYIEGNVGIGTNSPTEKLDVNGAIKIGTTTTTNAGAVRFLNGLFQGYNGSDWLTLSGGSVSGTAGWTDDGVNVRLTTLSDNVGIGVIAPTAKLDVSGTINGSAVTVNGINVGLHSGISGENITTGIVADAFIASIITRDSELENSTIIRDYNTSWVQAVAVGGGVSGTVGSITLAQLGDIVVSSPLTGGGNDVLAGVDRDVNLSITISKDIVASGTGMSGGANDVLPGADSDVTITLTTSKDIVAGSGLTGGEDNVLPGADADTTLAVGAGSCITVAADTVGVTDNCVNAATTDGFSLGETMGNCASTDVHKGDGACEAESSLSVSYATSAGSASSASSVPWSGVTGEPDFEEETHASEHAGDGLYYSGDVLYFDCSDVISTGMRCDDENLNVYSLSASDGSPDNSVYVDPIGRVGIGTTGPTSQLHVVVTDTTTANFQFQRTSTSTTQNSMLLGINAAANSANWMFADFASSNGGDYEFRWRGDGNLFMDGFTAMPADFAEWTKVLGNPEDYSYGDIIQLSETPRRGEKATQFSNRPLIGVVSRKPGMVGVSSDFGEQDIASEDSELTTEEYENKYNAKMIAVIGYTEIKVNIENGFIEVGDYLTPSSIPGIARKANQNDPIVAVAYDSYNGSGIGEVFSYVNVRDSKLKNRLANFNGGSINIEKDNIISFNVSNSTRMIIDDNGNVGIGTNSPGSALHVNGTVCLDLNKDGACNDNTASFGDSRIKKNISPIENPIEKIQNMRGINFDWKDEEYPQLMLGNKRQVGMIAQEVEKVLPEAVLDDVGEEKLKMVDYGRLTPLLVEAVKEQQSQINQLKSEKENDIESQQKQIEYMRTDIFNSQEEIEILKQENKELKRLICLDNSKSEICNSLTKS